MPKLNTNEWEDWIIHAKKDKKEAHEAFLRKSWSEVCFHSQQSCEKLLKALLMKEGIFLPIHDLRRLLIELSRKIIELERLKENLGKLTVHYYASRYPNAATRFNIVYNEGIARECVEIMDKLWRTLGKYLK